MKSIFTYPNNASTNYIHADYDGDDTVGYQKRVKELKDGTYKTHLNSTTIVSTVGELMQAHSKYHNHPALEEASGNNTIYKFWEQPIVQGDIELIAQSIKSPSASSITEGDPIDFVASPSGNHGLYNGIKVTLSNQNSVLQNFLQQDDWYVKKIDATTVQLATDAALTNLMEIYVRETANTNSITQAYPAVITDTGGHNLTVGTQVTLSGINGTFGDLHNGNTYYVRSVSGNDYTLSYDSAGNSPIGLSSLQTPDIETFEFDTTDNDITIGIDDASRYDDGARIYFARDEVHDNLRDYDFVTEYTQTNADFTNVGFQFEVSQDGSKVAVAENGGVYLWDASGGTLTYDTSLTAATAGTNTRESVALNSDGTIAAVGSTGRGISNNTFNDAKIKVFQESGGTWSANSTLSPPDGYTTAFETWGSFVDMSDNGLVMVATNSDSFAESGSKLYIFERANTTATFSTPTANFTGYNKVCKISGDGSTVIAYSKANDNIGVFKKVNSTWTLVSSVTHGTGDLRDDQIDICYDGSKFVFVMDDVNPNADIICYAKKNTGNNTYTVVDTETMRGSNAYRNNTPTNGDVSISYNGQVAIFGAQVWDIVNDEFKFRHESRDPDQQVDHNHNYKSAFGGGSTSDTNEHIWFANGGGDHFYQYETDDAGYKMIAWLEQYWGNKTLDDDINNFNEVFIKYDSTSGGRDLYKLYTDAALTTKLGFTGDDHLAGEFTTTTTETFDFPSIIGYATITATTFGDVKEVYTAVGNHQVVVENSTGWPPSGSTAYMSATATKHVDESNRYRLSGVTLVYPGNTTYMQQTGASTYVNNAEIKTGEYLEAGYGDLTNNFGYANWPANLSVSTDASGYITGVSYDDEFPGQFNINQDKMFTVQTVADTYTAPELSTEAQQDDWDLDNEWDTQDYEDGLKVFPDTVSPSNITVRTISPNSTTASQNGTKYSRTSGYAKYSFDVEYPPMTAQEYLDYNGFISALNGQKHPFLFKVKQNNTQMVGRQDTNYRVDGLRFKEDATAGENAILIEGFASNQSNAIKRGELLKLSDDKHGNIKTAASTTDANVYGEAKFRLATPMHKDQDTAEIVYNDPTTIIVSLDADTVEVNRDTAGFYYLSLTFTADEWK